MMFRRLSRCVAGMAALLLAASVVHAQSTDHPKVALQPSTPLAPMEWTVRPVCHPNCENVLWGQGMITPTSDQDFRAFLEAHPDAPTTVMFNSQGGNLGAALRIGIAIRARQLNTALVAKDPQNQSPVVCWSACPYAFLGGISRTVEADGILGVHQFSPSSTDAAATATGLSLADVTQVAMAKLGQYTQAMGASQQFAWLGATVPPSSIATVPLKTAHELNVDNSAPEHGSWTIVSDTTHNTLTLYGRQQQQGSDRKAYVQILPATATTPPTMVVGLLEPTRPQSQTYPVTTTHPTQAQVCRRSAPAQRPSQQCVTGQIIQDWTPLTPDGNAFVAGVKLNVAELGALQGQADDVITVTLLHDQTPTTDITLLAKGWDPSWRAFATQLPSSP